LRNVCVAAVTSTIREVPTEVPLGASHGLTHDCVVNCDNLFTIPKTVLGRLRGSLGPEDARRLDQALRVALDLD
jgi:mRNA interferase MazF